MAVADGAGSAKYSREGSRIACEEVTNYCMAQLANSKDFESAVKQYNEHKTESESDARKAVGDYIYKIVGTAAFKAHKSINAEAAIKKLPAKQYATTLLLAICKKFEFDGSLRHSGLEMVLYACTTSRHILQKSLAYPMKVNMQDKLDSLLCRRYSKMRHHYISVCASELLMTSPHFF